MQTAIFPPGAKSRKQTMTSSSSFLSKHLLPLLSHFWRLKNTPFNYSTSSSTPKKRQKSFSIKGGKEAPTKAPRRSRKKSHSTTPFSSILQKNPFSSTFLSSSSFSSSSYSSSSSSSSSSFLFLFPTLISPPPHLPFSAMRQSHPG